ncbi:MULTISPECIES: hypothetical protein [Bacillaceae]|uniref:hypothetical protein n=1 Tax=Bacillaceae TaxID=186817 RepID=UPI0002A4DB74|nr:MULTISPECIES: hypothetical protein [Bacillaceae]ELK45400.1 hypothetical protein D479_15102 [Halobacillus sp. BAB-2008]
MLKKTTLFITSLVMLLSFTVPTAASANEYEGQVDLEAIENYKLTPEEQKRADELWEQYIAIDGILENLEEEDKQTFLNGLFDPNFDKEEFKEDIILAKDKEEIAELNKMFEVLGSSVQFSSDVESVKVEKQGELVASKSTGTSEVVSLGFWGGVWDATKCTASIAVVFVPGAKAYRAIKALGGVKNTVKLLAGASNVDDWLTIGGGAAAEILGIAGVKRYCFG